jgi:hypothetical protein
MDTTHSETDLGRIAPTRRFSSSIILTVSVDGSVTREDMHWAVSLEQLQKAVGGHLVDGVPFFDTVDLGEGVRECVVFVNHEGKSEGLPVNVALNALWDAALSRHGLPGGIWADVLVGPGAIVFGDKAITRAL